MSLQIGGFGTSPQGTPASDIIIAQQTGSTSGNSIAAGDGDDLVLGDHQRVVIDVSGGNNSIANALTMDTPYYWSTNHNQDVTDPSIPYATVAGQGHGAGNASYFSVTVGAGQTITIDLDYADIETGGDPFDPVVELLDVNGNVLAYNDDGDDGGTGSVSAYDSFLQMTMPAQGTYYIRVTALDLGYIPNGATYLMNVSVTGHASDGNAAFDNDSLYGEAGADVLQGVDGDDTLRGGSGEDEVYGGDGDDILIDEADATADRFYGGDGDDTLQLYTNGGESTFTDFTGFDTIDVSASTTAWSINLDNATGSTTGASFNTHGEIERIIGSNYNDVLAARQFVDTTLLGGTGNDTLNGANGNDIIDGGIGNDLMFGGGGSDTARYADATGGVTVRLDTNVQQNTGGAGLDTLFDFSNLIGSTFRDTFTGNAGDNRIDGAGGDDIIEGGLGNDVLIGGAGSLDIVSYANAAAGVKVSLLRTDAQNTLSAGLDTLSGFEQLRGSAYADTLIGDNLGNVIDGGAGADTMQGGNGNDRYIVDNVNDRAIEQNGQGGDTVEASVSYTLAGQYIEALVLTGAAAINGSGNSLDNRLTGNDAANTLNGGAGNDILVGNGGADKLIGGLGNDTYIVDSASDVITELNGEGTDAVEATISYSLAGQYIEVLRLEGLGNINGTGNGLANSLTGNEGDNILNGGGGADTMSGGYGDDRYIVDNVGDKVFELSGEGEDTIESSVSFSLAGQYVETLRLTGSAAINGTGSGGSNALFGNSAVNTLNGGAGSDELHGMQGSDTLIGGTGTDLFWFETALGAGNVDKITDFASVDEIWLDQSVFTALTPGDFLSSDAFRVGSAAQDADDRIIYNQATGNLYYDADGSGAGAAVLFAQLTNKAALTSDSFFIIY